MPGDVLGTHDKGTKAAAGGAGQYLRPGSSLAVTTSANVVSDYDLAHLKLYDFDGDGELDVGAEQEAAREAHKQAVKKRMADEKRALRKQNAELKKRRDHMRYVADEGVKADEMDYLNDDDEDKQFWLNRIKIAEEHAAQHAAVEAEIQEENRVYRMRIKEVRHVVDTWASEESWGPIEERKRDEAEAAHLLTELRGAVQTMLAAEPGSAMSEALVTYNGGRSKAPMSPEAASMIQPLEERLAHVNKLLGPGYKFPIKLDSKVITQPEKHVLEPHELFMGGAPIPGKSRINSESPLMLK
jgi:hypothetical protein